MAGYIAYMLVIAVPAYLIALFSPTVALGVIGMLTVASTYRFLQNRHDEVERKAFLRMALPVYAFAGAMVLLWF